MRNKNETNKCDKVEWKINAAKISYTKQKERNRDNRRHKNKKMSKRNDALNISQLSK